MNNIKVLYFRLICSAIFVFLLISCSNKTTDKSKWWRGNIHTHTFWSDGDDFPESVAKWYKNNGYNFIVYTDHNILLKTPLNGTLRGNHVIFDSKLWQRLPKDHTSLIKYLSLFGEEWIETRPDKEVGYIQVCLKTLNEFRNMLEERDKFMLMMGQEWYNEFNNPHDLHLYFFDPDEVMAGIECSENEKVYMIKKIIERVDEYRKRSGRDIYPVLAHPLNKWCITAEIILEVEDLRFFEVYNGHPNVLRFSDEFHANTERIWDIVLSMRLETGNVRLLYGIAADDAHKYHSDGATPGRGWVMVRSKELNEDLILDAMNNGDFYSSTGVILKNIVCNGEQIHVEIEPQEGYEYITEYIGTLRGFDTSSKPSLDESGNEISDASRIYSEDIGRVLATSNALSSSYTFTGNELYVRFRVKSSADQLDKVTGKIIGQQLAWGQPVVPVNAKASGK